MNWQLGTIVKAFFGGRKGSILLPPLAFTKLGILIRGSKTSVHTIGALRLWLMASKMPRCRNRILHLLDLYHHAFGLDAIQAALLLRVGLEASGQLDVELIEADELALAPA
jgi:hypothetical protein